MHKKTLGLSSILMAGMLAVTSVAPAASTVYATECEGEVILEAPVEETVPEEEKAEGEKEPEEKAEGEESEEGAVDVSHL